MKDSAHNETLSCNSCHQAHRYDRFYAAVEACVGCHDDQHTQNYKSSAHYTLWLQEIRGEAEPGTGVSCATCHMPRRNQRVAGEDIVVVEHNQSFTLRPNEKMIRSSCNQCHGLSFAIDALADPELIENNFNGAAKAHILSIDMALDRIAEDEK